MVDISTDVPSLFPATYRPSKTRKFLPALFISTIFFLRLLAHQSPAKFFPIIAAAFVATILFGLRSFDHEITLYADSIQIKGSSTDRIIQRDHIYAIKRVGLGRLRIYCNNLHGPDVYIPSGIGGDAAWNTWMAQVRGGDKLLGKVR